VQLCILPAYLYHSMNVLIKLEVSPNAVYCDCCSMQDFGDYADSYYAVQTTEGEQIAQLISGYIDIILKKVRLLNVERLLCLALVSVLFTVRAWVM